MSNLCCFITALLCIYSPVASEKCYALTASEFECISSYSDGNIKSVSRRVQGRLLPRSVLVFHPNGAPWIDADFSAKVMRRFDTSGLLQESLVQDRYLHYQNGEPLAECHGLKCLATEVPILDIPELDLKFGDLLMLANLSPYSGRMTSWFTHIAMVISEPGSPLRLVGNDLFETLSESTLEDCFLNPWAYMVIRSDDFSKRLRSVLQSHDILSVQMKTCTEAVAGLFYQMYPELKRSAFEMQYPDTLATDLASHLPVIIFVHPYFSSVADMLEKDPSHRQSLLDIWREITKDPMQAMTNLLASDFPLQPMIYRPDLLEGLLLYATTELRLE